MYTTIQRNSDQTIESVPVRLTADALILFFEYWRKVNPKRLYARVIRRETKTTPAIYQLYIDQITYDRYLPLSERMIIAADVIEFTLTKKGI